MNARAERLAAEAKELNDRAHRERRDLSPSEAQRWDEILEELRRLDRSRHRYAYVRCEADETKRREREEEARRRAEERERKRLVAVHAHARRRGAEWF